MKAPFVTKRRKPLTQRHSINFQKTRIVGNKDVVYESHNHQIQFLVFLYILIFIVWKNTDFHIEKNEIQNV